ncbi:MAG: SpoIID/LytB domain-containing protein [Bacillota bacterium]
MKKIFSVIIIFIFSITINFTQDQVKVGLDYEKNINNISITSDDDFYIKNSKDTYDLKLKKIKIVKDDFYHLKYKKSFDNINNAISIANEYNNAYIHYDEKYYVFLERFDNKQDAYNKNINDFDVIKSNQNILIQYKNNLVFSYNSNSDLEIGTKELINYNGNRYRGNFLFKRFQNSDLTVINKLPLDKYLYGVLPNEMPADWDIEALKAQAVAARNYILCNLGRFSKYGFDVTDNIISQVYNGYDVETKLTNLAVDKTEDIHLKTKKDKLVVAYYHSNSGGHTENSENVWSNKVSYLKGVKDEFSENVHNSIWEKTYLKSEISDILADKEYYIGQLKDVEVIERSENGRVLKLKFKGSNNNIILEKNEIRKIFGYSNIRSTWFYINGKEEDEVTVVNNKEYKNIKLSDKKIITKNGIKNISDDEKLVIYNGNDYKEIKYKNEGIDNDKIKFVGKGYGHGLGMSQWGAKVMATRGYTYEEILKHYYKNTYLDRR